ncbi:MAG: hypothetical protein ACK55O_03320 [Phycisphaerales bacterium]|jgi:hypothetical protein|nr:hypothetical protein [Phycisphaeraceae bacterium]
MIDMTLNVQSAFAQASHLVGASRATNCTEISGFSGLFGLMDLPIRRDESFNQLPPPPLREV